MARPVPADLEDALAGTPEARDRFWALPAEQKDAWVAYVERARFPGARRRRVAQTVHRLNGGRVIERHADVAALPRENWSLWLAALGLLAAIAALVLWLTVFRDDGKPAPGAVVVNAKSTVPKVTGIRYQAAQFQLREAKLRSTLTRRNSAKPKGIVVGQTPKDGKTVPQGTVVALVVSKGPPGVALPDLTGMAAADAVQALQKRKLVPKLQQTPSQEAPGTVLAQTPEPGKRARPGTTVTLEVAKGRASVDVPSVVGQPRAAAVSALQAAGLEANVVEVPGSQPAGTVVAQSPAAGGKTARGSSVRLNVSKGPQQPTLRGEFAGQRLEDAVQQIAEGRRKATVAYVASSAPAGTVVSSSRAGGSLALRVSAGAQPQPDTDVPDTTGEDIATARSDLEDAGFTVIEVQRPVADPASDGVVVAQTPATAPAGSAIVVYVGSATG